MVGLTVRGDTGRDAGIRTLPFRVGRQQPEAASVPDSCGQEIAVAWAQRQLVRVDYRHRVEGGPGSQVPQTVDSKIVEFSPLHRAGTRMDLDAPPGPRKTRVEEFPVGAAVIEQNARL